MAGKGKNQLTFNQIALEEAAQYAAEDADVTLRLHQRIHPLIEQDAKLEQRIAKSKFRWYLCYHVLNVRA